MCSLDHDRMAVPDCKRATSITWQTPLSHPTRPPPPPFPSANPSRGDEVNEDKVERGELVWMGGHRGDVLEWKVSREIPAEEKDGPVETARKSVFLERYLETFG